MYVQTPFPIGPFTSRGEHPRVRYYEGTAQPFVSRRRVRGRWFTRRALLIIPRPHPQPSSPDFGGDLDDQPKLRHFVVVGEHVAFDGGREAALR